MNKMNSTNHSWSAVSVIPVSSPNSLFYETILEEENFSISFFFSRDNLSNFCRQIAHESPRKNYSRQHFLRLLRSPFFTFWRTPVPQKSFGDFLKSENINSCQKCIY